MRKKIKSAVQSTTMHAGQCMYSHGKWPELYAYPEKGHFDFEDCKGHVKDTSMSTK